MLKQAWKAKSPLMIYGGPGIGKSDIPRQVAPEIAASMNREYVEWDALSKDDRVNIINNPEKYWLFCDQRVGQMDTTDLRGIPMMSGEWLDTCPLAWIIYFTKPRAAGLIFFDEINLAPPTVAGQAYQIIQQRSVSDRRISDDVLIIAAGNRSQDKAFTFDMPMPLRDRFNETELVVDAPNWTKWAAKNQINSHLIAFINWKPSYLYTLDKTKTNSDKGSSPRAITRASMLIDDSDITSNDAHSYISAACGVGFATEFQAYVSHVKELDWEYIFNNPDSVVDFSIDKLWAIAGGMSEKLSRAKDTKGTFDKICNVITHMRKDFAIVTLRMLRDADAKKFKECVKSSKCFSSLAVKYAKFLTLSVD